MPKTKKLFAIPQKLFAIPLTFVLLTFSAALAFGQNQTPPQTQPEIAKDQYDKLFSITTAFLVQAQKVCKSEACATLVPQTLKIVIDAKSKHVNHTFTEDERRNFHKNYTVNMTAIRNELVQQMLAKHPGIAAAASLKPPDAPALCKVGYLPGPDLCQECYDTFEVLAEICALYTIVSPEAAAICLSAAILGFGRCILNNCEGPGYWPYD